VNQPYEKFKVWSSPSHWVYRTSRISMLWKGLRRGAAAAAMVMVGGDNNWSTHWRIRRRTDNWSTHWRIRRRTDNLSTHWRIRRRTDNWSTQ
jgi:hypothetical protein